MIKVLVVEDHTLTRIGLKILLKRAEDIEVVGEAINGVEAIRLAKCLKPDVILMDVGMPVMNGIQAAKEIILADAQIRVIMLTQHDNDRDIMASLSAGASGYCLKDVDPMRLYVAIRAVSSGDAWLDSSIAARVLKLYYAPTGSSPEEITSEQQITSPNRDCESKLDRPAPEVLSARETEVLKLIVAGLTNQGIADRLAISLPTAKTHVRNILNKLSVDGRTEAAVHAMKRGLI